MGRSPSSCCGHAGIRELARVGLALIAERIVLGRRSPSRPQADDAGPRKPAAVREEVKRKRIGASAGGALTPY